MENSILIIPTPSSCRKCQLMVDRFCYGIPMDEVHDNININERPKWCPLRSLPKREKANKGSSDEFKAIDEAWTQGFNACLSEITGETE